jgi:signal transduction histidine kinase
MRSDRDGQVIRSIYSRKQQWKILLLIAAMCIGAASLWYTNKLVKRLSAEEKKKVELWAQGTRQLADLADDQGDISFVFEVIKNNETVPVILVNENDEIINFRNLDSLKSLNETYLTDQLGKMKAERPPIEISLLNGQKNYIYYRDSLLITQLKYYPFFQLAVIALFLLVSYLAFSASRNAEQNQVWVGMAKETAHQLGTPLSSLMAWLEILRQKGVDKEYTTEIEKDILRLNTITERFSKIGSAPALHRTNIHEVVAHTAEYMQKRASSKLVFSIVNKENHEVFVPVNVPLFEWVLENTIKNSMDAMTGKGKITITITDQRQYVYIDITDTGKGLPKSKYKTIFKPGYTTKKRGWGLGLSLSKRIVEEYHGGQIFVKNSEPGKSTTIRIVLRKQH